MTKDSTDKEYRQINFRPMKLGEANPFGVIDDHRYLTDVENKDGLGCFPVKEQWRLQCKVVGTKEPMCCGYT